MSDVKCSGQSYVRNGMNKPVFFRTGQCVNFNGRFVKAEIKPNSNFNVSMVADSPLPKV